MIRLPDNYQAAKVREDIIPLVGGLDLVTPHISIDPGRLVACSNVMAVSGLLGYQRIWGYERFDGHPSPSSYDDDEDKETARALIAAPTGTDELLGGCHYAGNEYCWRKNGTYDALYKSTSSGWSEITPGETIDFDSGTAEFNVGAELTDGTATADIVRVIVQSGAWGDNDAAGYIVIKNVSGTFSDSTALSDDGSTPGAATSASVNADINLVHGTAYQAFSYNFFATPDLEAMFWCNGSDHAYMFDGTDIIPIRIFGNGANYPIHLTAHLNRLFVALPGGIVQSSTSTDPCTFDGTYGSLELGAGDEITGMLSSTLDTLIVFCENRIKTLRGTNVDDWVFYDFSTIVGAKSGTIQGMSDAWFINRETLTSMGATQQFGDFRSNEIEHDVRPYLSDIVDNIVCSLAYLEKSQYILFLDNKSGLIFTVSGKDVHTTAFDLEVQANCSWRSNNGVFFGGDDGMVYQLDSGNSFDGEAINGFMYLPFYRYGFPRNMKGFSKIEVDLEASSTISDTTTIRYITEYDYGSLLIPVGREQTYSLVGGGTFWNSHANWDEFYYDMEYIPKIEAYIDGIANNMAISISFSSLNDAPFTFRALLVDYVVLGREK